MSQQPEAPALPYTPEEVRAFEACIRRLEARKEMDDHPAPYPNPAVSAMFYLWQQATREAKA